MNYDSQKKLHLNSCQLFGTLLDINQVTYLLNDANYLISFFPKQLEVVGPGGPPDGHGDDDHH